MVVKHFIWKDCVSNGPEGKGLTTSLLYLHPSMALHCPIKFKLFTTASTALDGPAPACLPQFYAPVRDWTTHTSWKAPWSTPQVSVDAVPVPLGLPNSYSSVRFQFGHSLPLRTIVLKARLSISPARAHSIPTFNAMTSYSSASALDKTLKAEITSHSPFHAELPG